MSHTAALRPISEELKDYVITQGTRKLITSAASDKMPDALFQIRAELAHIEKDYHHGQINVFDHIIEFV